MKVLFNESGHFHILKPAINLHVMNGLCQKETEFVEHLAGLTSFGLY